MLPPRHRMRRPADFTDAVRLGVRGGSRSLVVHLSRVPEQPNEPTGGRTDGAPLVGFVVSKAVGGAVQRNTVKRRLRALMRERLPQLEEGSRVVVRALGPAAGATSEQLATDLDVALSGARRRQARTGRR